jgi:hypothetical protein
MYRYELREIKPGHFVKVVDGQVVGRASDTEVLCRAYQRQYPGVEPAVIEAVLDMTQASDSLKNAALHVENARWGYQVAVDLWISQTNLNWDRFGTMLVANSILLALVGPSFAAQHPVPPSTVALSTVGLFLCVAWFLLTVRGYDYHRYWSRSARELEEGFLADPVKTVSRAEQFGDGQEVFFDAGGKPGSLRMRAGSRLAYSQRWISYFVILLFALVYVFILVPR